MRLIIFPGRKLAVSLLALVIFFTPIAAQASLQNEMQSMFDTMTNVTDGGYHRAMGRGVVAGPSVVMRNNQVRTDLINFVPPSIDAGCGGIDMFLGSFSFIDGEHFVNLLQAIAANAAGYAFQLALSTMCPTCSQELGKLQRALQKANALAGDSCKAAQFLVDTAADKLGASQLGEAMKNGPIASLATAVGEGADAFSNFLDGVNSGSPNQRLSDDQVKALLGNIAWKILQDNGFVSSAFLSGDNELAEALMSVTGTVIGVKGDGDVPEIKTYQPTLTLADLIYGASPSGAKPKKIQCLNADCTEVRTADYEFKGLDRLVQDALLGDSQEVGPDSFIFKIANNIGQLTETEKRLIRVAPYHMTRLRNVAVCKGEAGIGSLETYAKKSSRLVALDIVGRFVRDALASINQASQGTGRSIDGHNVADALAPAYQEKLREAQRDLAAEHRQLAANLTTDLEEIYGSAISNCQLRPVLIGDQQQGEK
ncbi:MAG: conjugal transfer protein TraH [Desulfobacca sp.]|nr:conjugal transfer protein TraH [Desulfobacca sp.]